MLVLSRKMGEEILIGDNVKLVVNRIAGNRVTIGIEAPNEIHIVRGELGPQSSHSSNSDETARKPVPVDSFVSAM